MVVPSVTVLITVKNNANTIYKCMDSILSINYPKNRYKVFVVDAFSTDGTYEILKKFGNKIHLEQLKGNAPKAYNYAIKKIKTDFIAFTDGDCLVDKNWLKYLIKAFTSNDIVASAGFCKTPNDVNQLQKVIGTELEDRFRHFPKVILRAPSMNLCVRTEIMKKLLFDSRFDVAFETDLGYRIAGVGKMIYEPKALIYHYHRASWNGLYNQQYKYAIFVPMLYFKKHPKRIVGDNISKTTMLLQIILVYLFGLGIILSLLNISFFNFSFLMFVFLLLSYLRDIIKLSKNLTDAIWFLCLFFVRNVAWNLGILKGTIELAFGKMIK
jgi:glycosyltransferase involved in cell wall biosynthesis